MCNFNKGHLFLVLGLLVPAILLFIACGPSAPAGTEPAGGSAAVSEFVSNGTPQESVVAVNFSGKQLTPETIRVTQGDNVTLNLETDRPGSFHVHGYHLEKEAVVGEVTEFQFVADATGRFRITFHGAASNEPAMMGMDGMKSVRRGCGFRIHGPRACGIGGTGKCGHFCHRRGGRSPCEDRHGRLELGARRGKLR